MLTEQKAPPPVAQAYTVATIPPELAHFRLGHVGQPTAKINHRRIGDEVQGDENFDCEPCRLAKSKRIVSHSPQARATKPWEFVHIDLQPCKPTGIGGANHVAITIDDDTRFRWA